MSGSSNRRGFTCLSFLSLLMKGRTGERDEELFTGSLKKQPPQVLNRIKVSDVVSGLFAIVYFFCLFFLLFV